MADIAARRRQQIVELANRRGIISVQELCQELGVSDMTIRRDFRMLSRAGVIRRTRGGAMSMARQAYDFTYDERQRLQIEAKNTIGEAAAGMVSSGDTLFLGSGTTVLAMTAHLRGRERLTVITNSLEVVRELLGELAMTVVATGGTARRETISLVGPIAEAITAQFRVRKAFLGTTGISPEGFSNSSLEEATIQRKVLAAATETFLLADHTKFGKVSLTVTGRLSDVTGVVTDSETTAEDRSWLEEAGLRVVVASK